MPKTDEYLDAGMRGFIVRTAVKNAHRVAGCDVVDLIQEGYYCYYKCRKRYVGKKPTLRPDGRPRRKLPARCPDKTARMHFQRLVGRAFNNQIHTLAGKHPASKEVSINVLWPDRTEDQAWEQVAPVVEGEATLAVLLSNAPAEIRQLMQLLVQDAVDGYRRLATGGRETSNQRFSRLLGLPAERDIVGMVDQYFLAK